MHGNSSQSCNQLANQQVPNIDQEVHSSIQVRQWIDLKLRRLDGGGCHLVAHSTRVALETRPVCKQLKYAEHDRNFRVCS